MKRHLLQRLRNAVRLAKQHNRAAWKQPDAQDSLYHRQMRDAFLSIARTTKKM